MFALSLPGWPEEAASRLGWKGTQRVGGGRSATEGEPPALPRPAEAASGGPVTASMGLGARGSRYQ